MLFVTVLFAFGDKMKKNYILILNAFILGILFGSFINIGIPITQEISSNATILTDEYLLDNDLDDENNFLDIDMDYNQPTDYTIESPRTGTQNFAVICVRFADIPATRWAPAGIGGLMSWTNLYWQNTSYQMIDIDWDIYGWYDLPKNLADYGNLVDNFNIVLTDAINLAMPDVADWEAYGHILLFINTWFCILLISGPKVSIMILLHFLLSSSLFIRFLYVSCIILAKSLCESCMYPLFIPRFIIFHSLYLVGALFR